MDKTKSVNVKAPAVTGTTAAAKPAPAPSPAAKLPPLFRPIDWLTLLVATAIVFGGYLYTLAPDLTLEDSGELAVGSFYAGIPHPPGYPVWTIYTWCWTRLLPIHNIAWRVSVGEAFAGALACGLLGFLVSRGSSMMMEGIAELKNIPRKWENAICVVSGFVAATLLGYNGYMWSQSVIVEVYSFGVLSLMGVLLCLLRWIYAPHQRRYLYWGFFIFGICFTNHQTLICAAMGLEVAVAAADYKMGRNLWLWNSIVFISGLVLKAQSMLFTNTNPMIFWIFVVVGLSSMASYMWFASLTKMKEQEFFRDLALVSAIAVLALLPSWGVGALLLGLGLLGVFAKLAWNLRKVSLEWAVVLVCGIAWLIGVSFYLYMALAGMSDPPMQWGYPRTVEGFVHAFTRGQYEKTNPTDFFSDPLRLVGQLQMLFEGAVEEFDWVYLLLALVPFVFFLRMHKRERAWVIGISAIYLCLGVLLLILINPPPDRQAKQLIRVFFTASHVMIAMGVGYGVTLVSAALATNYQSLRRSIFFAGIAALDLALFSLANDTHSLLGEAGGVSTGSLPLSLVITFGALICISIGLFIVRLRKDDPAAQLPHEKLALAALGAIGAVCIMMLLQDKFSSINGVESSTLIGLAKILCWTAATCCFYFGGKYQKGAGLPGYHVAGLALLLITLGLTLSAVFGDQGGVQGLNTFVSALGRAFQPNQYALPVFGDLIVLGLTVCFLAGLWLYRSRAPLAISLCLFVFIPVDAVLSHWFDNEQRDHLFGYWFGHDMFTPPFVGPDGKFGDYDAKDRSEMMKDPAKAKYIYPEMARDAVLYGGTDPGRFCPTYMIFDESFIPPECKPRDPKFDRRDVYIITQNALADGTYLEYIRAHYNRSKQIDPPFFQEWLRSEKERTQNYTTNFLAKLAGELLDKPFTELGARIEKNRRARGVYPPKEIYIASPDDSQKCFQDYLQDAQRRHDLNQLKPGEDVKVEGGRVQVSGQVAVMAINGLITKVMFDHNPTNEFYVEESFPLDWMYPHLTPFGIIMKINRQPLPTLTEDILDRDHQFWAQFSDRLIGNWITYDTSVKEIVDFVEKVYLRHDFNGFKGDRRFARDDQGQKAFSKLRSSIGGIYAWRLGPQCPPEYRPKSLAEYQRIAKEADFTFRQALAFCPYSPEAVFRYVNLLIQPPPGIAPRFDDALLIAKTCQKLDPYNAQVIGLVNNLTEFKNRSGEMEKTRQNFMKVEQDFQSNPTNFTLGLTLANTYVQMQQTDRALTILNAMLENPQVDFRTVSEIANAFAGLQNWPRLEESLVKLTQMRPDLPEAWYDCAALQALTGKRTEALQNLAKAVELSKIRLAKNPKERDLIAEALKDERFKPFRGAPEFQAIVTPK